MPVFLGGGVSRQPAHHKFVNQQRNVYDLSEPTPLEDVTLAAEREPPCKPFRPFENQTEQEQVPPLGFNHFPR